MCITLLQCQPPIPDPICKSLFECNMYMYLSFLLWGPNILACSEHSWPSGNCQCHNTVEFSLIEQLECFTMLPRKSTKLTFCVLTVSLCDDFRVSYKGCWWKTQARGSHGHTCLNTLLLLILLMVSTSNRRSWYTYPGERVPKTLKDVILMLPYLGLGE